MTPSVGQSVILHLRFGFLAEGVVKEWSEDQIVLTANGSHMVIYNPKEDLILAKIMGKSRLSGIIPKSNVSELTSIAPPQPISNPIPRSTSVKETFAPKPESIDTIIEEDYTAIPTIDSIQSDIAETIAAPSGDLRIKKLGQLRTMLAQAERDVVANKLTSHQMQPQKKVEYVNPVQLFSQPK